MRADLHAHSTMSDGTTSPTDLVRAAAEAGLDVLGVTDHDTAGGWAEAAAAAASYNIGLLPGMEISTRLRGASVHLLAYLVDPDMPELAVELRRIRRGRDDRIPGMLAGLAAAGVSLSEEDVRRQAGPDPVLGRPHVADALVARGVVADRAEAFDRWLSPGRPGFVVRYAPRTHDMVRIASQAGGAAVLAHPWGRASRAVLSAAEIAQLAVAGLVGLEVDHQDHSREDRSALRRIADDLGLVVTGSSDHHGVGKADAPLGCNLTDPDELVRLLAAARRNATASGRVVPPLFDSPSVVSR